MYASYPVSVCSMHVSDDTATIIAVSLCFFHMSDDTVTIVAVSLCCFHVSNDTMTIVVVSLCCSLCQLHLVHNEMTSFSCCTVKRKSSAHNISLAEEELYPFSQSQGTFHP